MVNTSSRFFAAANEKGAVGKTATVLNAGAALSRRGQRVLIVAMDHQFNFILFDTPPSLSLWTINLIALADEVLVPCHTHLYAYNALNELFDAIAALRQAINPQLKIGGILATSFLRRTRASHRTLDNHKSEDRYRGLLFDTSIRVNTTIAARADAGKPTVFSRSGGAGASDCMQLAEELLKHQPMTIDHNDG